MIQNEKYVWMYFNTEADDDNVGISTSACFKSTDLVGMFPSGASELTLAFKSMKNGNSAVTDTVALTLTTANTHKDLMTEIVQKINTTRPTFGGFVTIADDLTTFVGGSATETPVYYSDLISACGAITLDTVNSMNGTVTATADGTGTGTVPGGGFYTTASSNNDHIVILPAPTPGTVVWLDSSAETSEAYELRTSDPTSIAINNVAGSGKESAIATGVALVQAICINPTKWIIMQYDNTGNIDHVPVAD